MFFKGSFRMSDIESRRKYLWQFQRKSDEKGVLMHHFIRPLFKPSCGTRFWEFTTRDIHPNLTLNLGDGDIISVDTVGKKGRKVNIVVTWYQKTNVLWSSVKDTGIGKIMGKLDNNNSIDLKAFENMDDELDSAVVFCHKLANGIQVLQDKIADKEDIHDLLPPSEPIKRTIRYICESYE